VTTKDSQAQALFDRGLFLYYAYDRAGAADAFAAAAARDPNLAMAYWGEALAAGPDLNNPMTEERFTSGQTAIARAKALEGSATARERDFIDAMSLRYHGSWDDWEADGVQYRRAMAALARGRNDSDATLLSAEAMMEHSVPTQAVFDAIGDVLAADPSNPMANHLCIHAYDGAPDRTAALPCAQRLDGADFPPEAEHLAHMPAHYWIETGSYDKAVASSERAYQLLLALERRKQRALGDEPYAIHDIGVGYAAALMLGSYARAIEWANRLDPLMPGRYDALTALRFARYADAASASNVQLFGPQVRGMALLHLGHLAEAQAIAADLLKAGEPRGDLALLFFARLAEAEGNDREARTRFDAALQRQRADYYAENIPFVPAGEALGGYLLRRGAFAEAAAAFTACLTSYPNDPRALFGLSKALTAQGKSAEAARARTRFDAAWAGADTSLTIGDL